MEYADKGDLFQLITERKKTKNYFTEQEVWRVYIQLLMGLKALHDFKILHRDIKSANVFLFQGGICKLGDLNVSKVARKGLGYTQTGTPYYASPEVWEEKPYDSKSIRYGFEKFSPERFVNNWKTPMLVIHGGNDYRVPITEGISTFTALQLKGVESKLLYFPMENPWNHFRQYPLAGFPLERIVRRHDTWNLEGHRLEHGDFSGRLAAGAAGSV